MAQQSRMLAIPQVMGSRTVPPRPGAPTDGWAAMLGRARRESNDTVPLADNRGRQQRLGRMITWHGMARSGSQRIKTHDSRHQSRHAEPSRRV